MKIYTAAHEELLVQLKGLEAETAVFVFQNRADELEASHADAEDVVVDLHVVPATKEVRSVETGLEQVLVF